MDWWTRLQPGGEARRAEGGTRWMAGEVLMENKLWAKALGRKEGFFTERIDEREHRRNQARSQMMFSIIRSLLLAPITDFGVSDLSQAREE